MRRVMAVALVAAVCGIWGAGCARLGNAGESCSAPGLDPSAFDGCAEGNVCVPDRSNPSGYGQRPQWDSATCREICTSNVQCADGYACVLAPGAGSTMACLPD